MREIIALRILGTRLVGTCHFPDAEVRFAPGPNKAGNQIGVMLLNPGYLPRSTRGDLGVQLSDHLATLGFPTFRFDMPGLGDSEGALQAEVLEFFEHVQTGGYEPYFTELKNQLVRRYQLDGVIYLGHCGGATTAVYSADTDSSGRIVGLVLLDPAFVWYKPPPKPTANAGRLRRITAASRRQVWNSWQLFRRVVLPTPPGQFLSRTYAKIKRMRRHLRREPLPADANVRLIRCWERLLATRKPILVLTAEPAKRKPDFFDYLDYLERAKSVRIARVNIAGTSHSFVEGNGKQEVFRHVESWLRSHFGRGAVGGETQPASCVEGRSGASPGHCAPLQCVEKTTPEAGSVNI